MQLLDCKIFQSWNALNISAIIESGKIIAANAMIHGISMEILAEKNVKLWIKALNHNIALMNPRMRVVNSITCKLDPTRKYNKVWKVWK